MGNTKHSRARLTGLVAALMAVCLAGLVAFRQLQRVAYPVKYQAYVEYYAGKYQLDPLLIYAVIRTESGFDPTASNATGARGLMQITEITFDWLKSKIAATEEITYADLDDPETNIRLGTYYYALCLDRYAGDIATASAAYYSGWGTVDELLADSEYSADGTTLTAFPYAKMNQYVHRIDRAYNVYQTLYAQTA